MSIIINVTVEVANSCKSDISDVLSSIPEVMIRGETEELDKLAFDASYHKSGV